MNYITKPGFHMITTIARVVCDCSDRCDHMETRLKWEKYMKLLQNIQVKVNTINILTILALIETKLSMKKLDSEKITRT